MPPGTAGPPFDQFLATAEAVAQARPGVDPGMARDVFLEVATPLHNGSALWSSARVPERRRRALGTWAAVTD